MSPTDDKAPNTLNSGFPLLSAPLAIAQAPSKAKWPFKEKSKLKTPNLSMNTRQLHLNVPLFTLILTDLTVKC